MTDFLPSALPAAAAWSNSDLIILSQDAGATLVKGTGTQLKAFNPAGSANIVTFNTKALFAATGLTFTSSNIIQVINVTGGNTGSMLWYLPANSSSGIYGEVHVGGFYWQPQYSTNPVLLSEWGIVASGNGGADQAVVIQAAIDWAIANSLLRGIIPNGAYGTDDTIHIGYGNAYHSFILEGQGGASFDGNLAGVTIYPSKTDRPGIDIAGGRISGCKNILLFGKNYAYINTHIRGTTPVNLSSTANDWLDPALATGPGGLTRYSPYAGFTVDAYKGTAPANPYPTGGSVAYGALPSSDVNFDNCGAIGFAAAFVGSPNGDGNGDFIKLTRFRTENNVYGVAICNTQSRGVEIDYINNNSCHTLFTSTAFGQRSGLFGGTITNTMSTTVYQLFDMSPATISSLDVDVIYNEVGGRIGSFGATSGTVTPSITIKSLFWNSAEELHGSIPSSYFVAPNGVTITLDDAVFNCNSRIIPMMIGGGDLIIKTNSWTGLFLRMLGLTYGTAAFQRAMNYSGGIVCPQHNPLTPIIGIQSAIEWVGRTNACSLASPTDLTVSAQFLAKRMQWTGGRQQMTQAVQEFMGTVGGTPNGLFRIIQRNDTYLMDISDGTGFPVAPVVSGDQLTFSIQTAKQNNDMLALPGDFLYVTTIGATYVIDTITSSGGHWNVVATQMNNMEVNITTKAIITNHFTTANLIANPTWLLVRAGPIMPQQVEFGTFTSGSTAVSSVSTGSGGGADFATFYSVGDKLLGVPFGTGDPTGQWPIPYLTGFTTLSTVTNGSPGSAVLSQNALLSGIFPIYPMMIAR